MNDLVEAARGFVTAKGEFSKFVAAQSSPSVENLRSECPGQSSQRRRAGGNDITTDQVAGDNHRPAATPLLSHFRLAAGDLAGQSDGQHRCYRTCSCLARVVPSSPARRYSSGVRFFK